MTSELNLSCTTGDGTTLTVRPEDIHIALMTDEDQVHLSPGDARELSAFLLTQAKAIEAMHPKLKEVQDIMPFITLVNKMEAEAGGMTEEEAAGYHFALRKIREKAQLRWS